MSVTTHRSVGKWTETRFRYLADICKGSLPSSNYGIGLKVQGVPYLTMEYLRGEIGEPVLVSSDSDLLLAADDDVLLLWDGSNAGEFLRAKRGVVSSTTALVTPKSVDPTFFFWTCKGQEARVRAETVGMGIPHVNAEFLANLRIQLPPLHEQRAIANYLDRETARMDALVAAKECLLDLLAEKRRALIARAVTRSLDPDVPFRDSGVPWLGEIPAHWKVVQLKFTSESLQTGPFGSQLHSEDYVTGGTPVVNPSHLAGGRIHAAEGVSVDEATADRLAVHRLSLGDIVFARRGEMGRCGVVEAENVGWLCGTGSLRARLRKNSAVPHYLALVFAETGMSDMLAVQSVGSTMNNLNTEILGGCHVPMPPLEEQHVIVDHVDRETIRLDAIRSKTERTIALLKERRTALISAAVTGQTDVEEKDELRQALVAEQRGLCCYTRVRGCPDQSD